jgi:hypothetical protein
MKKLLLTLFCFLTFQISFSQVSADSRLSTHFSASEITAMENNQSIELKMWNYYVNSSYKIISNVGVKADAHPLLSTQVATNPTTGLPYDISGQFPVHSATFNPFYFTVQLTDNPQIFKIGTGKIIVFYSKDSFIKKFNTTL